MIIDEGDMDTFQGFLRLLRVDCTADMYITIKSIIKTHETIGISDFHDAELDESFEEGYAGFVVSLR